MAEKILNTRIQLKHDTLANWQEKDTLLKKGEIAIAVIEGIDPSNKLHQPVMFKVGPGNFNNLEWASALAADVYAWAKKPSLDANDLPEIPGLKLGISFEVVGEGNAITNVAYDTTSKKFTFTKGETFATKQELEDVVANGTVVAEGAKIDVALDGNTYTVSHEAIAQAEAGKTVAARTYITGVTTDGYGHITGYTTATEEDQDTGVMLIHGVDAIGVDNTNSAEPHILLKLDDNAGNVELTQSMAGLKANIDLGEYAKLSDVPGIKVDNAVDADKLGGQDPTYYATATALANALAEAKQYADDNDANETFAISYANNTITLTGSNGTNSSFDASAFVKDSYLKEVDYNDITNVLTFTFIDNEDKLQAIPVDLTDLVDVYDADEITLTKTDATFSVKDGGISKTKLDSNVQASLDKADTALQAHQDISGKADKVSGATNGNFAGLDANGNLVDSGKKAADFATADQGEKADTAFGWGDHAQAGYATSNDLLGATQEVTNLANSIAGGIQSGTLVAAKATADAQGNVIADTYATNAKVTTLTNDLTLGNLTVGKAIEADTLDGKHAADFAPANIDTGVMSVGVAEGFKNTGTATAPIIDICQKGEEGAITWIFDCGGAE